MVEKTIVKASNASESLGFPLLSKSSPNTKLSNLDTFLLNVCHVIWNQ